MLSWRRKGRLGIALAWFSVSILGFSSRGALHLRPCCSYRHRTLFSTFVRARASDESNDEPHMLAMERLCQAWGISDSTKAMEASFRSCPELVDAVLGFQNSTSLADWLRSRGRIRVEKQRVMMERHPLLLARALGSQNVSTIQQIFEQQIGLTEKQYNRMCRQKSAFPHRWTRSRVRQIIRLLRDELSIEDHEILKMLLARPQVLTYQVSKWTSLIDYLEKELDLSTDEVSHMIRLAPHLITYSVDTQLRPTVDFLQTLGSPERIRHVVSRYPQVLARRVNKVLKPKLDYLAERLQLERPTDAGEIVLKYPPIFWLTPELLDSKVTFLETELDLTAVELSFLIGSYPQVLGLSLENNLQPKVEFLRQSLSTEELREFVLYQPSLLAYSLENRLRPRLDLLKYHSIMFAYSPPYLMSLTDSKFQEWIDTNVASWSISS